MALPIAADAVLFDLLTALLDSWTVWDRAAGMRTLWHNRAGIARPPRAPAPLAERGTLRELLPFFD